MDINSITVSESIWLSHVVFINPLLSVPSQKWCWLYKTLASWVESWNFVFSLNHGRYESLTTASSQNSRWGWAIFCGIGWIGSFSETDMSSSIWARKSCRNGLLPRDLWMPSNAGNEGICSRCWSTYCSGLGLGSGKLRVWWIGSVSKFSIRTGSGEATTRFPCTPECRVLRFLV